MKALCVKQPYAEWLVSGAKTIETRTWATKYRGPLLIVATKMNRKQWTPEKQAEFDKLPVGMAVGVVNLVLCREMTKYDEWLARCLLYPRAKAWVTEKARRINPFPVKGQLSLFEVAMEEDAK